MNTPIPKSKWLSMLDGHRHVSGHPEGRGHDKQKSILVSPEESGHDKLKCIFASPEGKGHGKQKCIFASSPLCTRLDRLRAQVLLRHALTA